MRIVHIEVDLLNLVLPEFQVGVPHHVTALLHQVHVPVLFELAPRVRYHTCCVVADDEEKKRF